MKARQIRRFSFSALSVALFTSLSAHAAPVPPDAGQTSRELQQQPALTVPRSVPSLHIEGETAPNSTSANPVRIVVKAFRVKGSHVFPASELEALLANLTGGKRSLAELEAGAARITAYYRAHGYVVARAYLPAQDVVDGVVTINVLEGLLGQQRINNKSRVTDTKADGYLDGVKPGTALQASQIDRALLLLNDTPGIGGTRASLQPGASVGTADLLVELEPSAPYYASVNLDNYGNRYTGENRLGATLAFNSPLKIGDQLLLRALTSDGSTTYARIAYTLPLGADGLRAGIAYSDTRYKLGKEFSALQADGSATIGSLYATYPFIRRPSGNLSGVLRWENKRLRDKTGAPISLTDKRVELASMGLNGNQRDMLGGGGFNAFELTLFSGRLSMDAASLATDAVTAKSNGAFTRMTYRLGRQQHLTADDTLSIALSGQLASKNLNSSEEFSLGGADGVRAYPQGEGSGDAGWMTNLELRHRFGAAVQGIVFYDAGSVTINRDPFATGANHRFLSGAGLGVNAILTGVRLKAYVAWRGAGGTPQSEPASVNRNPRVWVQASRSF